MVVEGTKQHRATHWRGRGSTIHQIIWCQRAHFVASIRVQILEGESQTNQQKTYRYVRDGRMDRVRAHRVTDDKEGDPKQDRKRRYSVYEVLDFRSEGVLIVHHGVVLHETTTLGFVNGPNASIAARHIRNHASACQ